MDAEVDVMKIHMHKYYSSSVKIQLAENRSDKGRKYQIEEWQFMPT